MKLLALIIFLISSVSLAGDAGLIFNNEFVTDLTLTNVRYVGQCPGMAKDKMKVRFKSETTDTNSDYRVKIKNITPVYDGDTHPYADREYKKDSRSERTYLMQSSKHRGQTFSVTNGVNNFKYKIYHEETKEVIEKGNFDIDVYVEEERVRRDMIQDWQWQCYGPGYPVGPGYPGGGQNCRWVPVWKCPM